MTFQVHTECVTHLEGTFKETDLFKLYQTIDLGNLKATDAIAQKLPALLQLRNALVLQCTWSYICNIVIRHIFQYAKEFRQLISDITGSGPLTERVDCAANVYTKGCHLLPHDDVIGTRSISYVIYLSDPEDEWTKEDGGCLELYPEMKGTPGVPAMIPTTTIVPGYNTMALFAVKPGVSFHSVQVRIVIWDVGQ